MIKYVKKSVALCALALLTTASVQASVFPTTFKTSKTDSVAGKAASTNVLYFGGKVISNAQIYLILWGDKVSQTTVKAMPDFYSSIVSSSYMDFLKEYNTTGATVQDHVHTASNQTIGKGSFMSTIQITPAKLSGTIDDTEIQAELVKQMDAGVIPAATENTLYMIHFPKGLTITMTDGTTVATSCQQFCAYHEGFQPAKGLPVYYGVMPDLDSIACSLGCGFGGALARVTVSSSHEMIEAITDPIPTPGTDPAYPQAWNTSDGQEIGDLCQSSTGKLTAKSGTTYSVQQEYSNVLAGCTTTAVYK